MRVNSQYDDTNRTPAIVCVEDWHKEVKANPLGMFIAIEIHERHLPRTQDFKHFLSHNRTNRLLGVRGGHLLAALDVQ